MSPVSFLTESGRWLTLSSCTTKAERCRTLSAACGCRSSWMKSTQQRSETSPWGRQRGVEAAAAPTWAYQTSAWESTSAPRAAPFTPNLQEEPKTSPSASSWRRRRAPTSRRRPINPRHTKAACLKRPARRRRRGGLGRGGRGRRGRGGRVRWDGDQRTNQEVDSTWSGGLCWAFRGRCFKTLSVSDTGEITG